MVDVLIQTFNEEANLPHTLESLIGWTNKIFVVDSGSTDRTVELARAVGANVVHHDWGGYAAQKNWALDNLPFEAPWILIVDADESISPKLRQEIEALATRQVDSVPEAGFLLNRVFIFMGREIRHCGYFPSWNVRLFKRGLARYEDRLVHEHMIVKGPVGHLDHLILHEDRRGLEHFFAKHNRYSTLEAREIFESPEPWPGVRGFVRDRVARRRFLKSRVLPHLPQAWTFRLIYMYVLRFGFLDGRAGWVLSNFISSYEFFIQIKYQELQRLRGRPILQGGLSSPEGQLSYKDQIGVAAPSEAALAPALRLQDDDDADLTGVSIGPQSSVVGFQIPLTEKIARGDESTGELMPTRAIAPVETTAVRRASADVRRVPVSVLIPTLNEASNLSRCLDHLQWADEVVVVDSGSTDGTARIAATYGANVVMFRWNGHWPKKKNWALRHAPLKHSWVLIVDADEWITPDLAREIERAIASGSPNVGYYINRRFIFMGRWIKHCGYYPSWNLRLFKRGWGEYEQLTGIGNTGSGDNEVHEHVIARGDVGYLDYDMLHLAFPNIHTFVEKHNRYSNWEAAVQFKKTDTTSAAIGDMLQKRRRLKNLSRYLPFRPTLRFLYAYLWMGGFLDGRPGYIFCRLLAIYEYLSVAKFTELKRAQNDMMLAKRLSNVPELWTNVGSEQASHAMRSLGTSAPEAAASKSGPARTEPVTTSPASEA